MNVEPKPFASLSSSLLARKGQAKPAMRPQGFAGFGFSTSNLAHDDLGWNDMGHEPLHETVTAEIVPIHADVQPEADGRPLVHEQQEELARALTPQLPPPAPVAQLDWARRARAAPGSKAKAAFTLRLDPDRHLQLRLVCAVEHRSAQQVVVAALDAFLAQHAANDFPTKISRNSR